MNMGWFLRVGQGGHGGLGGQGGPTSFFGRDGRCELADAVGVETLSRSGSFATEKLVWRGTPPMAKGSRPLRRAGACRLVSPETFWATGIASCCLR
jgi:hypothetical protein